MEGSNAELEVITHKDKINQPEMPPVPDLVLSTPASSTNTATIKSPTVAPYTDSPSSALKAAPVPKSTVSASAPTGTPALPRGTSAASEASVKNRSSREEKIRKKDDKSVDHVLRALNSLNTTEEKLAAMCKKYTDIFDEHRKLQLLHKQSEKRLSMTQREKEQLQAEHSKAILTRSRLENLCRELQRQNKAIKDESLLKIREEEEKRKEVSAKFQTTMNEITTLMQQNNDKNMKLRDDNIDMTAKLKSICEQYELRQQQVERISKQMQLEQQLADAKLSKLKIEMAAERETLLREKQQLLMELQQYQQRCTDSQATEVNLRNQITMYNDKYDEFQKALARSNDVFGGFKGEMEKMSKKICKLEKETSSWKQRWERSHNALLEMAADKQKSEQELALVSRQLATLQGLCRTLQTERSSLLAKLKSFQVGGPEVPEKPVGNTVERCKNMCEHSVNHIDQSVDHQVDQLITNHLDQNITQVDQSVSNRMDQSKSQIEQSVNDTVLTQYNQDILASFKETANAEDLPTSENTIGECAQIPLPITGSLLPDVLGTSSPCPVEQNPVVNSDLCERLEGVVLNLNVPDNTNPGNSGNSNSQLISLPQTNLLTTSQENLTAHDVSLILSDSQPPEAVVNGEEIQAVVNGEAITNGVSTDQNLSSSTSPKGSPTKTKLDSGKKTKESTKKKKK